MPLLWKSAVTPAADLLAINLGVPMTKDKTVPHYPDAEGRPRKV